MIATLSFVNLIVNIFCSEYVLLNIHETDSHGIQNFDEFKYFPIESPAILLSEETNDQYVSIFTLCFETNQGIFGLNNVTTTYDNQSTVCSELEEFLVLHGSNRSLTNHDYESLNAILKVSNSFNITNFNEYVTDLYNEITSFIKINLGDSDSTYFKRLNNVNKALKTIGEYESDYEELFTPEIDQDFINMLNILQLHYSDRLTFNYEDYKYFSDEFNSLFLEINKKKHFRELKCILLGKPNQVLNEFIKIYKYAKVIPEFLFLGSILIRRNYKKVILFLHFIYLFLIQNEDNLMNNRVFVLFLMKKTLENTLKVSLDIIFTLQYQELITVDRSKLLFFSWEFMNSQRNYINHRLSRLKDPNLYFCESSGIHYKIGCVTVSRLYWNFPSVLKILKG